VLPLLIYSVVRANPTRLSSNARYIRRYRVESKLTDFYAYCLTNLDAVISFVETCDLQELGLIPGLPSSVSTPTEGKAPLQPILNAAVRGKDAVAGGMGMAVTGVTGVVGSVFSRVLGQKHSDTHQRKDSGSKAASISSNNSNSTAATGGGGREGGRTMTSKVGKRSSSIGIRHRAPLEGSDAAPPLPSNAKLRFASPVQRYLEATPDTLRVSEIGGLLEDYKRLAAVVEELSRLVQRTDDTNKTR